MALTSESSEPQSTLVHSRNISTVSSATLHTSTTLHSQPYEPLLRPTTPASGEYYDVASHQSRHSDRILALPRWSPSNVISRDPSIVKEKKEYTERKSRGRTTLLRWSKNTLQTLMAIWSLYSTARYLLAFTIYQSVTGQVISLVLGAATGLSFALAACGCILSMAQTTLLVHGISVQALLSLRSTLYYLSSCCLLGPSVVNFVLTFLWKRTSDIELQSRYRCKLDVDLVWSITYSLCNHKNRNWRSWVALSAFRLLATLSIIIAFHLIASSSQFLPSRRFSKPRYAKSKKSHTRLESCETPLIPGHSQSSVVVPQLNHDPVLQPQASDSTLSAKSSPRNRLRNSRSRSSALSEDLHQSNPLSYNNTDFLPMNGGEPHGTDHELNGFVDRFRALISQITRETEEGLAFARSDGSSSHNTADSASRKESPELDVEDGHHQYNCANDNEEDDFYSASPGRTLEANDYRQIYPTDEHVRMMNAYVRRMPTIESMGSREMRSSLGASSFNTNRDRERTGASRPPTRNTLLSWSDTDFSGSEPRSRPNSLSAQAELLAGVFGRANATEVGELMRKGDTVRMVDNQSANDDNSEALGDVGDGYASTTSGSKDSALSYHTATTGSMGSAMSLTTALADATASPPPIPAHPSPLGRTETKPSTGEAES
ncbi:hypothetical protein BDZ97DRAFT_1916343 [Flammula alnicola]|nr:hypothetical protein BDZ97DRAFT_1916343 [Flammula alnicola]